MFLSSVGFVIFLFGGYGGSGVALVCESIIVFIVFLIGGFLAF